MRTTGPPRHEEIELNDDRLAQLGDASVDIRRHVRLLFASTAISHESLALMRRLPHLNDLRCLIDYRSEATVTATATGEMVRRFEFPPQLTTLVLTLVMALDDHAIPSWTQLERVLDAASQVSTLTSLRVTLEMDRSSAAALIPMRTIQPLARVRDSLIELSICRGVEQDVPDAFSEAHVDFLNSFDRLETILLNGVGVWTTEALEWISDPLATRIKSVDLRRIVVDDTNAAVVGRFTSLQYFHPLRLALRDPFFLANFTHLTSASLFCQPMVDPRLLVVALSHCTQLTTIDIEHPDITSDHLCSLLPSLPRLSSLSLMRTHSLTSLSFASSVGHLAHTLKTLQLCSCFTLGPDEVRHLRALTALESLLLGGGFNEPLDEDTIASMTPESDRFERDVWPHMIDFFHRH